MEKNSNTNTFGRWLDLILAIAGDKEQPVGELARILGTSSRNVYYVIKTLADYGFVVHHNRGLYNLDAKSPFFQEIARSVNFTPEQASYMYNLLSRSGGGDVISGMLRVKLQRFYHLNEYVGARSKLSAYKNTVQLERAIRSKRVVVLHDYASSHSQTISDRKVEPFMLLGAGNDLRAYEISTGKNKSFKVSRIGSVEILDADWYNEDKHREAFTDMFMFSGEEHHHIRLRLDLLARNLMLEEYPHSATMMTQDDKKHWFLETDVVNYVGASRFILGLYENIEVLEDDGLKKHLNDRIRKISLY